MTGTELTFTLSVEGIEYAVAYGPATCTAIISGPVHSGRKPPILHMIGQLADLDQAKAACLEWLKVTHPKTPMS